jgi:hypothetical protein
MPPLRAAEWINVAAFSCLTVLSWSRPPLKGKRRRKITAIGVTAVAITLFSALMLPRLAAPLAVSVVRDWVPYLLLLMFYWQGGNFVTRSDVEFEDRLLRLDRRIVAPPLEWCARHFLGSWILAYLELAYLCCYISMPLGLATIYVMREGREAGYFWTVVLIATYPCYALLAFLQTRPPRVLAEKWLPQLPAGKIRRFNLWILRHASIHANTFPSAHVASTAACALVLLQIAPAGVGLTFLWVALSIALGAVAGRYHYAADAILGFVLATAALLVTHITR